MLAVATTRVSVLRGTATNEFGDEIDADVAIASNLPASIIEQTRQILDPSSLSPHYVTYFNMRIDPRTDVAIDDRIQDDRTGAIYAIDNIDVKDSPVNRPDMRLNLTKVN